MRSTKAEIVRRVHAIPDVEFDRDHKLTSFSGLVLFQALFGHARVLLLLVTHVLMGFRRLRDHDAPAS